MYHEKQNKVLFALINEKGETLIEKRKGGAFEGKWLFPGGKIESEDADMVQAAIREIQEEAGFGVKDIEYLGFLGYFHPTAGNGNIPLLVFRTKKKNAKPSGDTGHELKWQSVDEVPQEYGHDAFIEMFRGVRDAVRERKIFPSSISVFTTRVDTVCGATYVVLAPEHPLVQKNILGIENYTEVSAYIDTAKNKSDLERTTEAKGKTGVRLNGVRAVNPATGRAVPVFVADYVLGGYGTGAVMAVPAHDERDFAFAKAHGLPVEEVIAQNITSSKNTPTDLVQAFTDDGVLVRSGEFNGMTSHEARIAITKAVSGRSMVKYKLHDWIFSRQRYWGEPIPLVFCEHCKNQASDSKLRTLTKGELLNPGWIALKEKDMPLELPNVKSYEPSGTGESPLAKIEKWVKTKCPRCGGSARRETNTMPQWAGSCWYYLRFIDPHNTKALVDKKKEKYWMPVDVYVGGAEHAVLHLLYARFWHKFLYDIGVVSQKEPFHKLINQGLILGPDKQKMSKSRGNVVNPLVIVAQLGADVLRMYEMFMGPLEDAKPWDTSGIAGIRRFLERTMKIVHKSVGAVREKPPITAEKYSEVLLHKTIKKVTEDIENFRFNTAISAMMILLNELEKQPPLPISVCRALVLLLAPFAPHLTEEMWEMLGGKGSVHAQKWPTHDKQLIQEDEFDLVVQVNGKVRDVLRLPKGITESDALHHATDSEKVKKFIAGQEIKKKIFIQDRLINIII
ncbi:MAG: leucine--tRNA ligase [Candidatus Azambacteria bacterium]|nr:leucine--tRNA ligase [Candidatus Azambacteria bacterium]